MTGITQFTLFSWLDFLYSEGALDKSVQKNIRKVQRKYGNGEINHDEYAELACKTYAFAMRGFSDIKKTKLLEKYIKYDRKEIFSFTNGVFDYMSRNNIRPIVVSGAPDYIINSYQNKFRILEIFAFCEESIGGFCTGNVKYNYGVGKKKTIELLCKRYRNRPVFGFGDSFSDIPIFEMSENAICITEASDNNKKFGSRVMYIDNDISEWKMCQLLDSLLTR